MMKLSLVLAAVMAAACAVPALSATPGGVYTPLSISDLVGNWHGHCQQYAAIAADGTGYCTKYSLRPVTYYYNFTYTAGSAYVFTTSDPVFPTPPGLAYPSDTEPGVVTNIAKYKYKSCVSVKYVAGYAASFVVTVTSDPITGKKTYSEEGVIDLTTNVPENTCLYKDNERLYCDAKRYNYKCTAELV